MLTRKEIQNRLRVYALKGVNKEIENGIVLPINAGFEALNRIEYLVLTNLYVTEERKSVQELADYFGVSCSTIYRIRNRALDILSLVLNDEYIEYNAIGKGNTKCNIPVNIQ